MGQGFLAEEKGALWKGRNEVVLELFKGAFALVKFKKRVAQEGVFHEAFGNLSSNTRDLASARTKDGY